MSAGRTTAVATKQPAPAAPSRTAARHTPQAVFNPVRVIQRKCACGGGCPKCEEEQTKTLGVQTKLMVGAVGDSYETPK